jgi:hypothetical protein
VHAPAPFVVMHAWIDAPPAHATAPAAAVHCAGEPPLAPDFVLEHPASER